MSRIYKTTDKIKLKIADLTFFVSPLPYGYKCEIQTLMNKALTDGDMMSAQDAAFKAIQYAVKEVKGLTNADGTDYTITTDGDILDESCVSDLLNIQQSTTIAAVCVSLINGVSHDIINPYTGKALEGVSFDTGDDEKKN